MKEFTIPILPISLAQDSDLKLLEYDIPGIESEYPWSKYCPRKLFTGTFLGAGTDGLAVSFCTEIPGNRISAVRNDDHTRVFDDDCLEIFLRPNSNDGHLYYAWEINSKNACLDYSVGIGTEGEQLILKEIAERKKNGGCILPAEYDSGEIVRGLFRDVIADVPLLFDYNRFSHAVHRTLLEDEFWYLELFIPWQDFGLAACPEADTIWTGTINRIDIAGAAGKTKKNGEPANPGLQCLLDDTPLPRFHQPAKFARFTFQIADN